MPTWWPSELATTSWSWRSGGKGEGLEGRARKGEAGVKEGEGLDGGRGGTGGSGRGRRK